MIMNMIRQDVVATGRKIKPPRVFSAAAIFLSGSTMFWGDWVFAPGIFQVFQDLDSNDVTRFRWFCTWFFRTPVNKFFNG